MAKRPSQTKQGRINTVCSYFADVDCGLSSIQRVQTSEKIQQRCREIRVSVTELLSDVLNALDPDYACAVPPGVLDRLPTDPDDAADGRHPGGSLP